MTHSLRQWIVTTYAFLVGASIAMTSVDLMSGQESDPLAQYVWKSRVLVIFAPDPADSRAVEQRQIISRMGADADERDLVAVELLGPSPTAQAERKKLRTPESGFQAVLVGKDGGAKLRSSRPLGAEQLAATIDAMPMRQEERRLR